MAFIHKTFCEDCGAEVADIFKHGPEVCPESPQNVKKRREDYAAFEIEYNRVSAAWKAWEAETGELKYAEPSVKHTPDEIAWQGKCCLLYETDYDNGELNDDFVSYRNFESPVLEDPTWGDIARQFDKAIPIVGDFHHNFLEGVRNANEVTLPVDHLYFCTGS